MSQELLQQLYAKERDLVYQLDAVRRTISALTGSEPVREVTPVVQIVSAPVVAPVAEKVEVKKEITPVVTIVKSSRHPKKDVYDMIIEVLKEENIPCSSSYVTKRLEGLNLNYQKLTIELYMRELEKLSRIKKTGKCTWAHNGYLTPVPAKQNIKTIIDVIDYFKLRKSVTRQELIKQFVKSGRFSEAMMQSRLEKLIKDGTVKRLEPGAYRLIEQYKSSN
jgi:hypothetical protein